jgi:adenylosuccinate synthase
MLKNIDLVIDCQFGSTGKGLLAGFLAETRAYDTIITAWAPNAGHTYIDRDGTKWVNIATPNGLVSPNIERVLLGPGSIIDPVLLESEWRRYLDFANAAGFAQTARLVIHPNAAVVFQDHRDLEAGPMTKIGSTKKGVGEAAIQRIRRDPDNLNTAGVALEGSWLAQFVVTRDQYDVELYKAREVLIEGAQGASLSMYHGFYPYTTSRDVSTLQILADCGVPASWAPRTTVYGTLRTFPIRVANRYNEAGEQVGFSGPHYADQVEIKWSDIGRSPELTTVTKLPRRLFSFSESQVLEAIRRNNVRHLFVNFANYLPSAESAARFVSRLDELAAPYLCGVTHVGFGPTHHDVLEYDMVTTNERSATIDAWWLDSKLKGL